MSEVLNTASDERGFTIQDGLAFREFWGRTPLDLSPDGRFLAYTTHNYVQQCQENAGHVENHVPRVQVGCTAHVLDIEQDADRQTESAADFRTVTQSAPSAEETAALVFAGKICKHTKSNTIVLARAGQLLASGVGQTSRVDALRQAIEKAHSFGFDLHGAVLASDAFFPFPDCVEIAGAAGIRAVVQPGGSIKDADSIRACDELGMAMVLTGVRHFKH